MAYGGFKNYFIYVVALSSYIFGGFFDSSTLYVSGSMGTPYVNGAVNIEDDYRYTVGLRK